MYCRQSVGVEGWIHYNVALISSPDLSLCIRPTHAISRITMITMRKNQDLNGNEADPLGLKNSCLYIVIDGGCARESWRMDIGW